MWKSQSGRISVLATIGIFLFVVASGVAATYLYIPRLYTQKLSANITTNAQVPQDDAYQAFIGEVYEKTLNNYFDKITDEQLSELFRLGVAKLAKADAVLPSKDAVGVKVMLGVAIKDKTAPEKKDFTAQLANIVLVNLKPFGRSGILSEKQQQALVDTVSNIDHSKDLYAALDLPKAASAQAVDDAFKKKETELAQKAKTDPEAKKQLDDATHARNVLTDTKTKQRYDKTGAEPTVVSHLIAPTVAYIRLQKFSPQTFDEFVSVANSIADKPGLDSLIIDLRDNIGGAVDLLQYFLGPFIGPGQYGYEFWHKGDLTPYKTKTGWLASLAKYKKVVVLVNGKTQSSAEVMTTTMKKYRVGVIVGTTTKGWGTIEQLIPLDHQIDGEQKYSMLLVQSITVRDDGQPIEGKGVDPMIKITDKDWEKQLRAYFDYPPLVQATKKAWDTPPSQ